MEKANEIGYFDKILALDLETSGMHRSSGNPCIDIKTGKYYQIVSIGLAIADTVTLKPVDTLYVEIKWDGESVWDKKAENKHGLTKDYLEKNGVEDIEAIAQVIDFIQTYWDVNAEYSKDRIVHCLGTNVSSFDIFFMRHLFEKYEIPFFPISNQFIDTNTIGWVTMGMYTSDKLFESIGTKRDKHNALEDALLSLESVRRIRKMCNLIEFKTMMEDSFK
jgi:hypothetical protein